MQVIHKQTRGEGVLKGAPSMEVFRHSSEKQEKGVEFHFWVSVK